MKKFNFEGPQVRQARCFIRLREARQVIAIMSVRLFETATGPPGDP